MRTYVEERGVHHLSWLSDAILERVGENQPAAYIP